MKLRLLFVFASLVFRPTPAIAQAPEDHNLLLVGATLIDGSGEAPVDNAWIHIRGRRIAAMGQEDPPLLSDVEILDLEGRTVIPGLADMHVHLGSLDGARWILKLLLAHGITTVHETGNTLGNLAAIRRWTEEQEAVPRVHMSGYIIDGDYDEQRFLQAGAEPKWRIEDEIAFGVDFVKTYNWVSSDALKQIAELAAEHDVPVTGHTPLSWTSVGAIDAGLQILQHLRLRPYEIVDDLELVAKYPVDGSYMKRTGFWAHLDPQADAVAQTLRAWEKRKDKFFVTPTLVAQEADAQSYDYPAPRFTENPDVDLVSSAMLESWKKESPPTHWGDLSPEEIVEAKASVAGMATFVGLAHQRGIRILSGTDTPLPWLVPGPSLHRELRFFVEKAGMTPTEAIATSTATAAEALRTPDRGLVKEGNLADLVIIRGNLAQDIGALRQIERVILGGRVYERGKLLEEAAGWAAKHEPPEGSSTTH